MRLLRVLLPPGRTGYLVAVSLAAWASVLMASAACALELAISGTSPMLLVLPAMLGTHAVIGIGEALITAALLSAVVASRPDIVPAWAALSDRSSLETGGATLWKIAGAGLLTALVLAAFLSPFASSSPDGLEKVAETRTSAAWPMTDRSGRVRLCRTTPYRASNLKACRPDWRAFWVRRPCFWWDLAW